MVQELIDDQPRPSDAEEAAEEQAMAMQEMADEYFDVEKMGWLDPDDPAEA